MLAAGAIGISGAFAGNAYSKEPIYYSNADIIKLTEQGKITEDEVVSHADGKFTIERKQKTEWAEEEAKEDKEAQKKADAEKEKASKRKFGWDLGLGILCDIDSNQSKNTEVEVECNADVLAFKKLLGIGIGTYTKGKCNYISLSSAYGSDTTARGDYLNAKLNVPILFRLAKAFYLGLGVQGEGILASIHSERADRTIVHTENYSGATANLLLTKGRANLDAYLGNISGNIEDNVDNTSIKTNAKGSCYGLQLNINLKENEKIIARLEGGKKGDYNSLEFKLGFAGKDGLGYGIKHSNIAGNNYNNSQLTLYFNQRFGRR